MTGLKEIDKQLEKLSLQKMRIEAQLFKQTTMPTIKASVGRTFVYRRNSLGDNKYFDTFRKLTAFAFSEYHAWLVFEYCEIRSDGKATLCTDVSGVHRGDSDIVGEGWKECQLKNTT